MTRWRAAAAALAVTAALAASSAPAHAAARAGAQDSAPQLTPRIINGAESAPGDFAFTVALIDPARYAKQGVFQAQYCGGTLTTPTTVVTAAHCVMQDNSSNPLAPSDILIGIGRTLDQSLRLVQVASIVAHPNYNPRRTSNDIAVITLAAPVTDAPTLAPVLPQEASGYAKSGATAIVAGWGNTQPTGNHYPTALNFAQITVFPDASCGQGANFTVGGVTFQGFSANAADPAIMLCADGVTPEGNVIDTCQGDSGGPLVEGTGPTARLIGVTSWGENCSGKYPGVYTRISAMADFLAQQGALAPRPASQFALTIEPLSESLRILFSPPPDAASVTAYAATVTDPATGAVANCFAAPTPNGMPSHCTVAGLVNGTSYSVAGIYATAAGNSAPTAPVLATPAPVPSPGRIAAAKQAGKGKIRFRVTQADPRDSEIQSHTVRCASLATGQVRTGRVRDLTALVTGMKPGRYSCTVTATNQAGTAISDPRLVISRR